MIDYQLILIAAGGGLAVQLLNLLELSHLPISERPNFRDWVYYIPYVLNPIISAFIVFVYLKANTQLSSILVLHIGASAPALLRAMASAVPSIK